MSVFFQCVIRPVALLAELVYLHGYRAGVVRTHDRLEYSPLIPADVQFMISDVVDIIVISPCEEAA